MKNENLIENKNKNFFKNVIDIFEQINFIINFSKIFVITNNKELFLSKFCKKFLFLFSSFIENNSDYIINLFTSQFFNNLMGFFLN